ncbi:MAG: light-harvesting protein [Bradyrhizobiaceae bacterium]|jgi:light-harvesting protein B-800-850 alpha chain|uniref:Light-harvesting protein n=1 Tax=Bradyrhizobium denitrificans TaxID=2734912 RepID=A0ABS5G537_9BRAD|nr:light harvesting protein B-800-850, alpha chain [Bradyrhizobium sp. BTAi1]MBR1136416.1 light-harvesting protein [Bradyrhizobium denitrificans]NPU22590.1 light-harvesting protein [Bradyrhizobium sp. LMG 8443]RTL93585.1 MAG: light-harvesting protein [Bradyrhizobiaceae bacterium]
MNQGRIWCVVNPTVGLPLFLGSVALTSLCVHYTVLTHTTWMGAFFEGGKSKKASLEETVSPVALNAKAVPGYVISVAPVSAENARAGSSFVVTVAPVPAQAQATSEDTTSHAPDKVSLATLAPRDDK